MNKILIVEDDVNINNLLKEALSGNGYTCGQAFSGTEAALWLEKESWALVLLDLMLPGMTGEEVLGLIRRQGDVPVIVLTAKDALSEKLELLTNGADDYITKPFNILEVKARIKAIIRRNKRKAPAKPEEPKVITSGKLRLDIEAKRLYIEDREIRLTVKEFDILKLLAENPGKIYGREQLLTLIWGSKYPGDARTVDVNVRRLREKVEENPAKPEYIHTKWGMGYYFQG